MAKAVLTSPALTARGFVHGFSTRHGGVSEGAFASLDFAILRDPDKLRENQRRFARAVGFDVEKLYQTRQVHGRTVAVAGGDPARFVEQEADAVVAEPGSGAAACVRVADCVPVLVADPASGRVAAIHAGWQGVVAQVVEAGVSALARASGAGPASGYVAAIGPAIGACCFEVGLDVAEKILSALAAAPDDDLVARRDEARGKAFLDLRRGVRAQLRALGLADAAIDDVPGTGPEACTKCNARDFYSYRRDHDASGRQIGVIVAR